MMYMKYAISLKMYSVYCMIVDSDINNSSNQYSAPVLNLTGFIQRYGVKSIIDMFYHIIKCWL